jgi:hypothetical protein
VYALEREKNLYGELLAGSEDIIVHCLACSHSRNIAIWLKKTTAV